ncbi:Thymidylate kinase [Chelonia mydas]|uniref:dTMP kinase n=1 Tax=Chelonia mydas TaxID=8469 RepID=M7AZR9_CHEMY|nr:Thymidylate kinase [Chelonia mydas]
MEGCRSALVPSLHQLAPTGCSSCKQWTKQVAAKRLYKGALHNFKRACSLIDQQRNNVNRDDFKPLIKEKLNQGITLVVDRYAFSGVAFTSAKENFSLDWCKQPDVGLPKPDLILFLQLSTLEAAKRGDFGNERYENSSFQEKVLQNYYHLIKDKTLNWKTIDASKSIEELHNEIKSFTEEVMQEVQNKPIGELWN